MISVEEAKKLTETYIQAYYKEELDAIEEAIRKAANNGYSYVRLEDTRLCTQISDYLKDKGFEVHPVIETIFDTYREDVCIRW